MEKSVITTMLLKDFHRYRSQYRYISIISRASIIVINMFLFSSYVFENVYLSNTLAVIAILLYNITSIVRLDKQKILVKDRINRLFEVLTSLASKNDDENQYFSELQNIIEKGLLLTISDSGNLKIEESLSQFRSEIPKNV